MSLGGKDRTSVALYDDTKQRFDRVKPYESMSADEFVDVLLDRWEGQR
jgi:hypothetical protein